MGKQLYALPAVCADPTRVRQILIILIDNAIKFTPPNGVVKVQARMPEGNAGLLILEISDSGCGINPDMTERIFERLFQASDPASAGRKGLGLGLYICKELVTRQGGHIWAESAPGQGAIFSVTLPLFSLPNLLTPVLRKARSTRGPVTLLAVEIGSKTGWLSDEVRSVHSHEVRDLLQRCLHSDVDVLLPKIGSAGAAELFFIVAVTDRIGGEAIAARIHEQMDGSQYVQQAGLTHATFCRTLDEIRQDTHESTDHFVEKVAAQLQELINDDITSRGAGYAD